MATANYNSKQFYCYLDSEKAWELIEKRLMGHNIDVLDELYPDDWDTDKNTIKYESTLNQLLLPGEQYNILAGKLEGYCLTSFGRLLNAKYPNQVIVYFAKDRITTSVRNIKIYFAAEFMKMGWSFNIDEIKRKYDKYKWKYQRGGINYNINPK
jgi:hypothetical protein